MMRYLLALLFGVVLDAITPLWAEPVAPAACWHLVATDLPPLAREQGADAPGALVEMVREMAHRSGQDICVDFLPWTRAQFVAQRGSRVLILPLTRTPEREDRYRWVVPLYGKRFAFFALGRRGAESLTVERLRGRKVGLLRSAPDIRHLQIRGFTQIVEVESVEKMARMLRLGFVDALYGDEVINRYTLLKNGIKAEELSISAALETGVMWLGGSKDISDEEIERWQGALTQIRRDSTYTRILEKYQLEELPVSP